MVKTLTDSLCKPVFKFLFLAVMFAVCNGYSCGGELVQVHDTSQFFLHLLLRFFFKGLLFFYRRRFIMGSSSLASSRGRH